MTEDVGRDGSDQAASSSIERLASMNEGHRWWAVLREAARVGFQPTHRNLLHWMSWIFALELELVLVFILRGGDIYLWELDVTRFIQDLPVPRTIIDVAHFLTNTLSLPFLILFTVIVAVVFGLGFRLDAGLLLLTFPLHVLAQFPKALIDRPRPSDAFLSIEGPGGSQSFPSGHAEFVMSFYGFLTYLVVQRLDRRWQQVAVVAAWGLLVFATGFGRIALGRHWPLDIIASYVFGLGILSGLVWLRWSLRQAIDTIEATGQKEDS